MRQTFAVWTPLPQAVSQVVVEVALGRFGSSRDIVNVAVTNVPQTRSTNAWNDASDYYSVAISAIESVTCPRHVEYVGRSA